MPLLLVDLDDTLVDRAGAFHTWATQFAAELGLPDGAVPWLVEHDGDGFRDRPDFFAAAKEHFAVPASVEELERDFFAVFPPSLTSTAEVRDALVAVRAAGWRIAIVSNGAPTQELKIRAAGLDELVDTWCVSSIEGCRKPDRRILDLAAARCGASLEGAWLVGDAPDADIGGAVAAGLPSIWLRRGRTWSRTDYGPTFEADTFAEAVTLLPL